MEFSPTSSPDPAQRRVATRAGFGDEWEKTHISWKQCEMHFLPCYITYFAQKPDLQQQTDSSCHFEYIWYPRITFSRLLDMNIYLAPRGGCEVLFSPCLSVRPSVQYFGILFLGYQKRYRSEIYTGYL